MSYQMSSTEYHRTPTVPPIVLQAPADPQFATADSGGQKPALESDRLIYLTLEHDRRFASRRYSATVIWSCMAFLLMSMLAIVTSVIGLILEVQEMGIISVVTLAAAGVFAMLWVETAQRDRQQLDREAH